LIRTSVESVSIQTGVASSNARQRTPASCLRALITTVAGEIVHTSRIVRGVFVEIARGAFALLGSSWSMADAEAGLDDGPPLRETLHRPKAENENLDPYREWMDNRSEIQDLHPKGKIPYVDCEKMKWVIRAGQVLLLPCPFVLSKVVSPLVHQCSLHLILRSSHRGCSRSLSHHAPLHQMYHSACVAGLCPPTRLAATTPRAALRLPAYSQTTMRLHSTLLSSPAGTRKSSALF